MKVILTGKNSYIGRNTRDRILAGGDEAQCVSVREDVSFKGADTVIHCAAVVHKREEEYKDEYEKVNFQLTKEIALRARNDGVRYFVFLSTMAVYGVSEGEINENTPLLPKTLYGKSKLKAEEYLLSLKSDDFGVAIVRPPMVYGRECPGNFQRLKKIAEIIPVIPDIGNKKSLIYAGNLACFLRNIAKNRQEGIFMPMDGEYVSTAQIMQYISGRPVSRLMGAVKYIPLNVVKKAFGSLYYSENIASMIDNYSIEYAVKESVK